MDKKRLAAIVVKRTDWPPDPNVGALHFHRNHLVFYLNHLVAAHDRHADVQQDDIGHPLTNAGQCFFASSWCRPVSSGVRLTNSR